jgi:hypothetical protein
MVGLQLRQRTPKRSRLVGTDTLDEVHKRRLPATGFPCLVESVDHQACDQLVAPVRRCVPVGAVVAVLHNEVLFGEPLEHGHDRGVGEIAFSRKRFMYLADRLRLARSPQVIHHRAF